MPQETEPGGAEDDGTRSPFRVASIADLLSFSLASSRYAALNAADSVSPRKASGIESNELPSDFKHLSRDLKSGHTLAAFVVISASYMLFTFTDGSLRMIVLLAAYNKDFTAMEVLPSPCTSICLHDVCMQHACIHA